MIGRQSSSWEGRDDYTLNRLRIPIRETTKVTALVENNLS
jgi:hypothetical protein